MNEKTAWNGSELRRRRRALDITLVVLGKAVGASHQAVWQWENGIRPDDERIKKLAKALQCAVKDLTS